MMYYNDLQENNLEAIIEYMDNIEYKDHSLYLCKDEKTQVINLFDDPFAFVRFSILEKRPIFAMKLVSDMFGRINGDYRLLVSMIHKFDQRGARISHYLDLFEFVRILGFSITENWLDRLEFTAEDFGGKMVKWSDEIDKRYIDSDDMIRFNLTVSRYVEKEYPLTMRIPIVKLAITIDADCYIDDGSEDISMRIDHKMVRTKLWDGGDGDGRWVDVIYNPITFKPNFWLYNLELLTTEPKFEQFFDLVNADGAVLLQRIS